MVRSGAEARAPSIAPGRDWRFWGLLGLFALLLGLRLATPELDSDQAVTGLMGVHILRGEFPVFFWGQDHAGVPESYGAAVTFFLLGVSRLSLSLVPAIAALGLVLALYRTAAVLFGHGAGLLAILFATAASPYVAAHYVLPRAYYIEQVLAGQVVLLGAALWLARGRSSLSDPARCRVLVAMGLAGGVGLYCNFQIVGALVPAALALLLVDPLLPLRRGAWLGLAAFGLGSAPFWIDNLVHGGATFATAARFAGGTSGGEAARVLFLNHLPKLLGVHDLRAALPQLPGALALAAPMIVAAAIALLMVRVARGFPRLRQDPALAGEAMLLAAVVVTVGLVWLGRFVRAPRYLVPLGPVLALILARASQLVWRRARVGAVLGATLYVGATGVGLVHSLPVLWPESRAQHAAARATDEALFAFLRAQGLRRVYSDRYWLAPRLTFDAREEIIVAEPFDDRHPPYTAAVDAATRPAFLMWGATRRFEGLLRVMGTRAEREGIGPYTIYWDFTPPPPVVPVPRAEWRLEAEAGSGVPGHLTDGQLSSRWSSAPGPPGSGWVEVDLGRTQPVAGITLVADQSPVAPTPIEVAVADGPATRPVASVVAGNLTLAWRNGAPRFARHAVTARFGPIEARRLRLTDRGPGGTWAISELFVLAPADASTSQPSRARGSLRAGGRLEAERVLGEALVRYRDAMREAPDDPEGYAEFARVAAETGLSGREPADQASRYLQLGLPDEARVIYASLAAALDADRSHAELAERRARVAREAGDQVEARRHEAEAAAALVPRHETRVAFGSAAELIGYDLPPTRLRPGEIVEVTLHWQLSRPATTPAVAYVHFHGAPTRFGDDRPLPAPIPGLGDGPQHVQERRRVVVPSDAEPGRYRVVLGVWEPESGRQVRQWWRGLLPRLTRGVELGHIEVVARP